MVSLFLVIVIIFVVLVVIRCWRDRLVVRAEWFEVMSGCNLV